MESVSEKYVHIGNVIRNAVVFDFKKSRGEAVTDDNLIQTVDELFKLLDERRIDYLLVGGIAVLQYTEGRNTQDIDLIMAVSSLAKIPEIEVIERNPDFIRGRFKSLQIDLLLTTNPLFDRVMTDYATKQNFIESSIRFATVDGLLLLKLYALPSLYRQGSFARVGIYENDVATLMQLYRPDIVPLLGELKKYLDDTDFEAVNEIADEIQQRITRFQQRSDRTDR
ncbi:MAG: hypothetical protein AB7H86_07880 [Blastocatellales bacterium]